MAAKDNGGGGKYKYDDGECNDLSLDVSLIDQLQEGKCAHCDLVIIYCSDDVARDDHHFGTI